MALWSMAQQWQCAFLYGTVRTIVANFLDSHPAKCSKTLPGRSRCVDSKYHVVSMETASLPPLAPSDDTHHAASIIITTAILLFTSLLFVGTRLIVRSTVDTHQRRGTRSSLLGTDDSLVVASTVREDDVEWRDLC